MEQQEHIAWLSGFVMDQLEAGDVDVLEAIELLEEAGAVEAADSVRAWAFEEVA